MSIDPVRTPLTLPLTQPLSEDDLVSFMEAYEPVTDVGLHKGTHACSGGCGRRLSGGVALCVRCRNASSHPAFGRF